MILFGHRGARGEAPENTVTGLRHALAIGVTAFELDVRLTADDQLAVIHDATVDRTTNGHGPVAGMTAAALARLDARAAFPDWPEPAGVPTLAEVLDVIAGAAHLQIEIKTDTPNRLGRVTELLLAAIADDAIADRVSISSFDPVALEWARRLAPDQPRCFIGAYDSDADIATALRLGARGAAIPLKTGSAERVRQAHDGGLVVTGWQGNTEQDIKTLLAWGVDNITSDYPTLAHTVLAQAGRLPGEFAG